MKRLPETVLMRRGRSVVTGCLVLVLIHAAAGEDGDALTGQWVTKDEKARVEITRHGDVYEGVIVWLKEPDFPAEDEEAGKPKRDRENPDPALRSRPIIGLRILQGFTYAGDNTWTGGSVYDPENGKTYRGKLRLEKGDRLILRGYVAVTLFGRTEIWTRYKPPAEEAETSQ